MTDVKDKSPVIYPNLKYLIEVDLNTRVSEPVKNQIIMGIMDIMDKYGEEVSGVVLISTPLPKDGLKT